MAPFVPDVIGEGFNLIIGFLAGFAFGFVLEQAGFSSTRKLTGLFYGTDFTVLKVFFTAGITALTGILLLSHFGLLHMPSVYINPLFWNSAIIGGLIMGAGFIIGGFCPGTSVCAASIGRVDGLVFLAGSTLGVWFFIETYPMWKDIFTANFVGNPTVGDFFGISNLVIAMVLSAVAVVAFVLTSKIAENVTKTKAPKVAPYLKFMALIPFVVGAFVALTPNKQECLTKKANSDKVKSMTVAFTPADKLLELVTANFENYQIVDVRDSASFSKFSIPGSVNIPVNKITEREWKATFNVPYKTLVIVAADTIQCKQGLFMASKVGDMATVALREPVEQLKSMYFNLPQPDSLSQKHIRDVYRFRTGIANKLNIIEAKLKDKAAPKPTQARKVKGGCA